MARLLYLDFLRMVSPGENLDPSLFDFYVFGNFDAIKIVQDYRDDDTPCGVSDYINTFQELHATSKQRRLDVPTYFDKQPMHLYSPVDSAGKIFQTKGKYAEQPLVLTLIQLDDFLINSDTPDNLVRDMGERLKDHCLSGIYLQIKLISQQFC